MTKKITSGVAAIMIAVTFAAFSPHTASAGGYKKLHVMQGLSFISMNGKMAPKKRKTKTWTANKFKHGSQKGRGFCYGRPWGCGRPPYRPKAKTYIMEAEVPRAGKLTGKTAGEGKKGGRGNDLLYKSQQGRPNIDHDWNEMEITNESDSPITIKAR